MNRWCENPLSRLSPAIPSREPFDHQAPRASHGLTWRFIHKPGSSGTPVATSSDLKSRARFQPSMSSGGGVICTDRQRGSRNPLPERAPTDAKSKKPQRTHPKPRFRPRQARFCQIRSSNRTHQKPVRSLLIAHDSSRSEPCTPNPFPLSRLSTFSPHPTTRQRKSNPLRLPGLHAKLPSTTTYNNPRSTIQPPTLVPRPQICYPIPPSTKPPGTTKPRTKD